MLTKYLLRPISLLYSRPTYQSFYPILISIHISEIASASLPLCKTSFSFPYTVFSDFLQVQKHTQYVSISLDI